MVELFEEGMKILSLNIGSTEVDRYIVNMSDTTYIALFTLHRPYQLLTEAAAMGNCKAQEQLAYFNLVGTIDTAVTLCVF